MSARPRRPARGGPAAATRARPTPPPPVATPGRAAWLAVTALALAWTAVVITIGAIKYRYYLYRDFDLAIFTQALAQLTRGSFECSIRGMAWPGDHSSLVLFALVPFYALARHPLTLVCAQTLALAAGAFPLAALARREGLGDLAAVAVAALWLAHPALGYGALYEFHPEFLAAPALIATFGFLRAGRRGPMLACAGLAASCREDVALVLLAMAAITLATRRRDGLALAGPLALVAVASLALTFGVLQPAFNQGESSYGRMYQSWGATPAAAARAALTRPLDVVAALFHTPGDPGDGMVKRLYHVQMLLPVMGLALLAPLALVPALPVVFEHFLSSRYQQHTIVFQYTALVLPSLACATVLGLRRATGWLARVMPAARAERTLAIAALACAAAAQLLYGPFVGRGVMMRVPAPQAIRPSGAERAAAPWRDRFVRAIPRDAAVVAGFEFLPRLADRPVVHSLHHVLLGRYTFSDRPFPLPEGIGAVVADLADPALMPYVQPVSSPRLLALLERERLAPVAACGDLVLFAPPLAEPEPLVRVDTLAAPVTATVGFDDALAYLAAAPGHVRAHAGEAVPFETRWRRTGAVDRTYRMELALFDATGRARVGHTRLLGYGAWAAVMWPADAVVRERAALLLPSDLPPGNYTLGFDLGWRVGSRLGAAVSDLAGGARDPRTTLATIEVAPGPPPR